MIPIKENKNCYATPVQREVLVDLIRNGIVTEEYFLTGGTALAVFYLHHRRSNDLDFFTLEEVDLVQLDFVLRTTWRDSYVRTKVSQGFLSALINQVKVEFVIDRLSNKDRREVIPLEPERHLKVDTPQNILSNKLCTLASRTEPKDYIDYYILCHRMKIGLHDEVLKEARKKDAIFDDTPSVAYQIEEGIRFVANNRDVLPELLQAFDFQDFLQFYNSLVQSLYNKGPKSSPSGNEPK